MNSLGIACTPASSKHTRRARLYARLCTRARPGRLPASDRYRGASELKSDHSLSFRRIRSAKKAVSCGIWRTISENTCQKTSKYSPILTKYINTKRASVQAKSGGYMTHYPQKRPDRPVRGGGVYTPPENGCTPARLVRLQESGVRGSPRP